MAKRRNAPVVNNGLYRNLHKQVNETGRAMKRVREEGYGGVDSAIRSLYKNAASTQKGYGKTLKGYQERQLGMVTQHLANSRKANKRLTHATTKRLDAFGGGPYMNEGNAQAVNTLQRQAKNDARVGNVGARSLGLIADTAAQAMDVMNAGTREAGANARTLAAESFSQRTNEDLESIAAQHHDISMAKLQHVQQLEMLDKQHEQAMKQLRFQERNAEDALKTAGNGQVALAKQQVGTATAVAQELYTRIREGEEPQAILADLVAQGRIDPEDMQSGVVKYLVRAAQMDNTEGKPDLENMANEIMYALEQMPAFAAMKPKQKQKLRDYVKANNFAIEIKKEKAGSGGGVGGVLGGIWDFIQGPSGVEEDLASGAWDFIQQAFGGK